MSNRKVFRMEIKGMDKIKKEIDRIGGSFADIADKAVKKASTETKKNIKTKTTPLFRQKPLQANVKKTKKAVIWRVGFNKKWWYLKYFESGTKRHTIRGKPRLAIHGKYGRVYFVKRVRHPGTRAKPFMVKQIIKPLKNEKEKIIAKEMWRQIKAMQ